MESEKQEVARLEGPPTTDVVGPIVETHRPAVSFDQDLRDLPQTGPKDKKPAREMGTPPNAGTQWRWCRSRAAVSGCSSCPGARPGCPLTSFPGLDLQNWGNGWPPDTHGDVGPNHYIQAVNTSIGMFDKATGTRLAAFTFNNFFKAATAAGGSVRPNTITAIRLFSTTRFPAAGSSRTSPLQEPAHRLTMSVLLSPRSADPVSGGWWLYTLVADTASLNDYPKLGHLERWHLYVCQHVQTRPYLLPAPKYGH